jgi:uncharacterized protein YecT (DUF1311 family)
MHRVQAFLAAVAVLVLSATTHAERAKLDARDVKAVQDCLESDKAAQHAGELCIGVVADPCLDAPDGDQSTAGRVACTDRELAVWDQVLNENFRVLRDNLDAKQRIKLRDMQRAWVTARDKTCNFFWDYFQGTMATPMEAYCRMRETARRAMFIKRFRDEAEGR